MSSPIGEGVSWLAAVRDAFSNRIVGWVFGGEHGDVAAVLESGRKNHSVRS